MRILLTSETYLPYLSGVTVAVDALARGLGAVGHEVLVLAPRPEQRGVPEAVGSPGPEPEYAWLPSYQLPRLVPAGYRMPIPLPWTGGVAGARQFAAEVVHAHSPFVTGLLARRLARAAGAPLVFTHHTRFADYGHYLGPLAGPGAALADAYLARFWTACEAIIAPSTDLAADIRASMRAPRRDSVHVIPTGIDVATIGTLPRIDSRPAAGWPADSIVVAMLGRLAPEKSPMTILEGMALAAGRVPALRLLVIGGGPSERELTERASRPDLSGRVHFTGRLPRTEALARMAGTDLFVFASRTETQGIVLAEALAAGLPAVALDGPGVRDSVRDGVDGVVVSASPRDLRSARLADAIAAVALDATRRAEMAVRARGDAARFAVEGRVAETEAVYRSLRP